MVHAGFPPQWTLEEAQTLAQEVKNQLCSSHFHEFLERMYGHKPDVWTDTLSPIDRQRYVLNALTRLRYCEPNGKLYLKEKGPIGTQPKGVFPWFSIPSRRTAEKTVVFGHWASLEGKTGNPKTLGLDTGCVWGGKLTALCLETSSKISVAAIKAYASREE